MDCPEAELLEVLQQQTVSLCDVAVDWWGPMICQRESKMLERVLKTGLHVIFQNEYKYFKHALARGKMRSLKTRRLEIITRSSKKAILNEKHKSWFCAVEPQHNKTANARQRSKPRPLLKPVTCRRTDHNARSSLPFMTRILSWHPPLVYTPPGLA